MPAFSGLYDGVFGDGYAALAAQSRPPMLRGLTRVLMQKRGMHGTVNALGRASPATITQTAGAYSDMLVRGSFDYATRTDNIDYTIENAGDVLQGGAGAPLDTVARVPDATEADLANSFDTTLNSEYANDDAENGATGDALAGVNAT